VNWIWSYIEGVVSVFGAKDGKEGRDEDVDSKALSDRIGLLARFRFPEPKSSSQAVVNFVLL